MTDTRESISQTFRDAVESTKGEMAVFICPGCKEEIHSEMAVYFEWGGPNMHSCGWRGQDLELNRVDAPPPNEGMKP